MAHWGLSPRGARTVGQTSTTYTEVGHLVGTHHPSHCKIKSYVSGALGHGPQNSWPCALRPRGCSPPGRTENAPLFCHRRTLRRRVLVLAACCRPLCCGLHDAKSRGI